MHTTSGRDCKCNPQEDTCGIPPIALRDIIAAALDGNDWQMLSVSILAHPESTHFPQDLKEGLGALVFAKEPSLPNADMQKRIRSAASYLLKWEGVNV